jgi:hypothetical protein
MDLAFNLYSISQVHLGDKHPLKGSEYIIQKPCYYLP